MLENSEPRYKTTLVLVVLAAVLMPHFAIPVRAPSTNQSSIFYFHRQSMKAINTFNTTLWSNTTQLWSTTTQTEARGAVKGTAAVWDFYSEPIMASNTTITGPLTFTLYLGSNANSGTGTIITGTVSKVTTTGTVVPLAVASVSNVVIGTTISIYTLTIVSNTYQLEAGSNLDFTVTINITSRTYQTLSLYYDVPAYRSQASLTFQGRFGESFNSYDSTGASNHFFSRNSTLANRQVTLRATVFDSLGLYDIALANTSIISPTGSVYLSSTPLLLIRGSLLNYTGTWSLNFTYAAADPSGNYQAILDVVDNGGTGIAQQLSYQLYATLRLNLQTFSSDSLPAPISGVLVTIYSSGIPVYSGVSNSSGGVVPGNVLLKDNLSYYVTSSWNGVLVNQTGTFGLTSSTLLSLRLSIYRVDFSKTFRTGDGRPLSSQPSSFQLSSQVNGSITSPNPSGSYLLPAGTYTVSSVIWNGIDVTPPGGALFNSRSGSPSINLQVYNLTVLAIDQNGQAIPNAQVTVTRNGQTFASGNTGNDGSVNLGNLPSGQYVVQVRSQSASTSSNISLTQDTSQKLQVIPPAPQSWIAQTWGWFVLLGAAVGSILGYRQISKSRLTFKDEPFDYLNAVTGGFRDGDTILIVGDEASGKTTLCEELAYKALIPGSPVIFLTYEGAEHVRGSMKKLKLDPYEWESRGRFQLIPCETSQGLDSSYGMVENFYGIAALSIAMNHGLEEAGHGKPVMIVDPLTSLAETASVSGLVNLLVEMSGRIRKMQGRLFLSISKSIPKHGLSKIEEAADGVLSLNRIIEDGKPGIELRVKKMRGRKYQVGPVRLRIDPKKGIVFEFKRTLPMKGRGPGTEHS